MKINSSSNNYYQNNNISKKDLQEVENPNVKVKNSNEKKSKISNNNIYKKGDINQDGIIDRDENIILENNFSKGIKKLDILSKITRKFGNGIDRIKVPDIKLNNDIKIENKSFDLSKLFNKEIENHNILAQAIYG